MNTRNIFVLLAASCFVFGCSSNSSRSEGVSREEMLLRELEPALRAYSSTHPKGPSKIADLGISEATMNPEAMKALKAGEIVVVWGVKMLGEGDSASASAAEIVAYEKKGPTEGGYALFQNGVVKKLSASDFKLPK